MSLDIKSTILSNRYKATVQPGSRRYQVATYSDYRLNDTLDSIEYITTKSVQIDMHPADFNRLVDTLDYLHGDWPPELWKSQTASAQVNNRFEPVSVHEKFIQHVYQKQFHEEELREKHPLLQDLWNQYKTTLNLLASGVNIESNE